MQKTLFVALTLWLAPTLLWAQNGLQWSPEITVNTGAAGNLTPRLALLSDGSPAAVWGASSKIWFAKWTGAAFSTPVQISTGGVTPGLYDFGGLAIAASAGRVFVVFEKFNQGIFCVRSDDNGTTWQAPVTVFAVGAGQGATIAAVAADPDGNPLVSFLKQTSSETNANVQLVRSLDGGLTFPLASDASAPAEGDFACECCYQDILPTGGDTVFVAFRANRNNTRDSWVTRSTDGGNTFDTACDADAQDWLASVCPFSGPQLAPLAGDSLLSVWMSKTTAGLRVFGSTLSQSNTTKGWEFQLPSLTSASSFSQNHPDVAGQRDTVAVVWEETGFTGTGQDLVCAFSTTGTAGLAQGNLFNVTAATGTQKFPQIAYRNGVFHLLYASQAQGVLYRSGTVVPPNAAEEPAPNHFWLKVSPNPATDFLHLECSGETVQAEIFSALGRLEQRQTFSQNTNCPLGDLPAGFYFLKLSDSTGKVLAVRRFFKN